MNNVAKKIGKNSFIVASIADILGIFLSFLINANLTNTILEKAIWYCYCIRFELILALLILITVLIIYLYFTRINKHSNKYDFLLIIIPIIIAIVACITPIKKIAISRTYYHSHHLYQDESQKTYFDKANGCIKQKDWEKTLLHLQRANDLYPNGYYSQAIQEEINNTHQTITFCDILYNSYIKPPKEHIPINSLKCAKTIAQIFPSKYSSIYEEYKDSVMTAITSYPNLYKAKSNNNYQQCRNLILQYGWCWFEPTVYEKLSYDNEKYVMQWLDEYCRQEDPFSAQLRMIALWFGEDVEDEETEEYEY